MVSSVRTFVASVAELLCEVGRSTLKQIQTAGIFPLNVSTVEFENQCETVSSPISSKVRPTSRPRRQQRFGRSAPKSPCATSPCAKSPCAKNIVGHATKGLASNETTSNEHIGAHAFTEEAQKMLERVQALELKAARMKARSDEIKASHAVDSLLSQSRHRLFCDLKDREPVAEEVQRMRRRPRAKAAEISLGAAEIAGAEELQEGDAGLPLAPLAPSALPPAPDPGYWVAYSPSAPLDFSPADASLLNRKLANQLRQKRWTDVSSKPMTEPAPGSPILDPGSPLLLGPVDRTQGHEALLARQEQLVRRVESLKWRFGQASPEAQTFEKATADARTAARGRQERIRRAQSLEGERLRFDLEAALHGAEPACTPACGECLPRVMIACAGQDNSGLHACSSPAHGVCSSPYDAKLMKLKASRLPRGA